MRSLILFSVLLVSCGSSSSGAIAVLDAGSDDAASKRKPPAAWDRRAAEEMTPSVSIDRYDPCAEMAELPTRWPRLVEVRCVDSDGRAYAAGYVDSELGISCLPKLAADLRTRCLPENEQGSGEFADPACTEPLAFAPTFESVRYIGIEEETDGGTAYVRVFLPGSRFVGDASYVLGDLGGGWGCYEDDAAPKLRSLRLIRLGDEVPASTFAEVSP